MQDIITLSGIAKTYRTETRKHVILTDIDLNIAQGDFVTIVGKSGSGKSTLLNIMSGIDRSTSGQAIVNGVDISHMHPDRLDSWRGQNIGLVFQFFQLIPTLTVLENVILPMDFCNIVPVAERLHRARDLLAKVELADKIDKFPGPLSGGEKQRVAIARALANDPPIILGDEPTGNLDSATADTVFRLFADLNRQGKTVVLVTHDPDCQAYSNRSVHIVDGAVASSDQISGEQRHA